MASITLSEALKLSETSLKAGIIKEIITVDAFYDKLPFVEVVGNTNTYNREATEAGAGFLDVAGTIAKSAATFTTVSDTLVRIVADVEMDQYVQRTGSNTNDQLGVQIAMVAKKIGRVFKAALITGDSTTTPKELDGLANLVTAGQTVTASSAAGGAALSLALLDQTIDLVTAKDAEVDFLVMPARTLRSYLALLRALGGIEPRSVTSEGRPGRTFYYRDIPIYRNDNITAVAAASPSTNTLVKVYAGCFGEMVGFCGLIPADVDDLIEIEGPFMHQSRDEHIVRLRMLTGSSLYSTKALAMLEKVNN